MAKLIFVIEVVRCYGRGIKEDPYRSVTEYWSTDGKLLATDDKYAQPPEAPDAD